MAQIVVGAAQVWTRLRPWAVVLHVALSVLIWATLVALATVARAASASHGEREPCPGDADAGRGGRRRPTPSCKDRVTAYYRLTKPEIIFLLLVTTVPAMFLARARASRRSWLILATLVGGTLAAGSANAINQYLDRDIDEIMSARAAGRSPPHAVTPEQALRFGFVLGAVSFFFLAITVNVLAAELALSAIAFYVFVYTMWLKRTTTQNIVIGGAAGAVPALVGWAAVTGSLAAPAWILFAIVFVWTPPHFWALAHALPGRLRGRGRADAAGGARARTRPGARSSCTPWCCSARRCCWCPSRTWARVPRHGRGARRRRSSTGRCGCGGPATRRVLGAVQVLDLVPRGALRRPSRSTRCCPSHAEGEAAACAASSWSISPRSSCSFVSP